MDHLKIHYNSYYQHHKPIPRPGNKHSIQLPTTGPRTSTIIMSSPNNSNRYAQPQSNYYSQQPSIYDPPNQAGYHPPGQSQPDQQPQPGYPQQQAAYNYAPQSNPSHPTNSPYIHRANIPLTMTGGQVTAYSEPATRYTEYRDSSTNNAPYTYTYPPQPQMIQGESASYYAPQGGSPPPPSPAPSNPAAAGPGPDQTTEKGIASTVTGAAAGGILGRKFGGGFLGTAGGALAGAAGMKFANARG
ncbi:hypothetical protein BO82DRAFT_365952 [Aspergillus uvarum CBS 121591]|uniref:Glycine zipper 2TM domain-containing protein n=1 Tax=Aspergillus uvarum CBS 121591 TaxID=1448315 RepID=A0A319C8Z0_9EURO|nr:hypothetical protein BO82DRAFT_365952 [Aspergillus uvarum CBS 121591]PYH80381.1 hypothetical protein BO82DRAFT_365952 [Aspergillus uvarum CBS 121591]